MSQLHHRVLLIWICVVVLFGFQQFSLGAEVAHYTFEGSAVDITGTGNDGTVLGGGGWVTGRINQAMIFDGIDDAVEILDNTSLRITDAITLSAWVKPTNTGGRAMIIKGPAYQLRLQGLALELLIDDPDADPADMNAWGKVVFQGSNLQEGVWSHVAATYDYTTRKIQLYINGLPDGSGKIVGVGTSDGRISSIAGNLYLSGTASNQFMGVMDEVRIFNTALSGRAMRDLYKASAVAYFKLNDNGGTIVSDASSFGNDGTINGSPAWVSGKMNQGLQWASGDWVEITNNASLDITNAITLSAWVKPTSTGARAIVIDGRSYQLRLNGLQVEFLLYDSDADQRNSWGNVVLAGPSITEGHWSHITATYDSTTRQMQIYINGQVAGTGLVTTGGTGQIDTVINTRRLSNSSYPFVGVMDEVMIDSVAQTADLIQAHYQADISVAQWRLDELVGTTGFDLDGDLNMQLVQTSSTWNTAFGAAYDFGTTADYFTIPYDNALGLTESFTLTAWVNPVSTGARAYILNGQSYQLRLGVTGNLEVLIKDSDATQANAWGNVVLAGPVINTGEWSLVAASYDHLSRLMKLYVNGVEVASLLTSGGDGLIENTISSRTLSDPGKPWGGLLYDVHLFNEALSLKQMKAHGVVYPNNENTQGVYAIWNPSIVFDLPYVKGGQVKAEWAEIEVSQGVYDFTIFNEKLKTFREQGIFVTLQIDGNYKPEYLKTIAPYWPGSIDSQVLNTWTAMYWHPAFLNRYEQLLIAFANYAKQSPYVGNIVGTRMNFNALGTEHYNVDSQYQDASLWTTPTGVTAGTNWTYQTAKDYKLTVAGLFVQYFADQNLYVFVRTGARNDVEPTYEQYFLDGRMGWFHTSSEAEPRTGNLEGQYQTFVDYAAAGYTTAYAESWASAWGEHGFKVDDRWCSPPQWNYWRLLFDLQCGVSNVAVYGADLKVALTGTYISSTGLVADHDDAIAGTDYKGEFNAAFEFASKYAGFIAKPTQAPGAWIAFRENDSVLAVNSYSASQLVLSTFTSDYKYLMSKKTDESVGLGVITIGPSDQRYGAWARELATGKKISVALDNTFNASIQGKSVTLRVTYLADPILAGTTFDVTHSGTTTTSIACESTGKWVQATITIPAANFTPAADGSHITLTNSSGQTMYFHMVKVER